MYKKIICVIYIFIAFQGLSNSSNKSDLKNNSNNETDKTNFRVIKDYFFLKEQFFPVIEGTDNQEKLIEYITGYCNEFSIPTEKELVEDEGYTTLTYNISASIDRSTKKRIYLIIPYNSVYINNRYHDNSISVQIGLELLNFFNNSQLIESSLTVVFSGGNGYYNDRMYGIEKLKKDLSQQDDVSLVTVIDILSSSRDVFFTGSSKGKALPSWLLKSYIASQGSSNGIKFSYDEIKKARFGFFESDGMIRDFIDQGLTACLFTNMEEGLIYDSYYNKNFLNSLVEYFKIWVYLSDIQSRYIKNDYNYQYISLFDKHFIISEIEQIVFFLVLILIIVFLRVGIFYFRSHQLVFTFRIIPLYAIIFLLYLLFSFIPRIIILPVEYLQQNSNIFLTSPFLYLFSIFIVPLLFIIILLEKIKKLPFPSHNFLYIYGATIFSYINLFIVTVINISIAYIYIFTLIVLTASHMVKKKIYLKYILYFISSLPLLKFIYDLVIIGQNQVLFMQNQLLLHILFVILTFPFILLLIRIHLFNRSFYKIMYSKFSYVFLFFIMVVVVIIFFLASAIFGFIEEREISVTRINDNISGEYYLRLESDHRIGEVGVVNTSLGRRQFPLEMSDKSYYNYSTKKAYIPVLKQNSYYTVNISKNYNNFNISFESDHDIKNIDFFLVSSARVSPADSNYNYKIINDEIILESVYIGKKNAFSFFIPRNPGKYIEVDFKIIPDLDYTVYYRVEFYDDKYSDIDIEYEGGIYNYRTFFIDFVKLSGI